MFMNKIVVYDSGQKCPYCKKNIILFCKSNEKNIIDIDLDIDTNPPKKYRYCKGWKNGD